MLLRARIPSLPGQPGKGAWDADHDNRNSPLQVTGEEKHKASYQKNQRHIVASVFLSETNDGRARLLCFLHDIFDPAKDCLRTCLRNFDLDQPGQIRCSGENRRIWPDFGGNGLPRNAGLIHGGKPGKHRSVSGNRVAGTRSIFPCSNDSASTSSSVLLTKRRALTPESLMRL